MWIKSTINNSKETINLANVSENKKYKSIKYKKKCNV